MANLYLERSGRWWVLAAGATNTNGKGGAWGRIPANSANSKVIGIEAGNNGIGEAWPEGMQESYTTGVAALAKHYRIDTANVLAHHEWAPSRKVDPAGPSRFGSINHSGSWNMDVFRNEVNASGEAARRSPLLSGCSRPRPSTWCNPAMPGGPLRPGRSATPPRPGAPSPMPTVVVTVCFTPVTCSSSRAPPEAVPRPGQQPGSPRTRAKPRKATEDRTCWRGRRRSSRDGVIGNSQDNRDSFYGQGMAKAVLRLQQSWGWDDADGVVGEHTWRKLHGGT